MNNYGIIIIKLKVYKENYNYLEIEESFFNVNSEKLFENKSIYILYYPKGKRLLFLMDMQLQIQMKRKILLYLQIILIHLLLESLY